MLAMLRHMAVVCSVVLTATLAAPTPSIAVSPPRVDVSAAIEAPAPYQAQFLCSDTVRPGVKALRDLLLKTYAGTRSVSEVRACGSGLSTSEHYDGRALDWGVNVANAKQKKQGQAMLDWLLAPDEYGNSNAMARRLGIMYVIWNKRVWRSYTGEWGPYSCSGVTACHKDHMHISFGWAGALKKTSYWTKQVSEVLPPPIPVYTSAETPYVVKVSTKRPVLWGPKALKAGLVYSYRASGVWKYDTEPGKEADAACTRRGSRWERSDTFRASGVWHWAPTVDTGGGCNTKDHTYVATVVPGISDAIRFTVGGNVTDNSGTIRVTIRRVL
jgi:hypothetical protein